MEATLHRKPIFFTSLWASGQIRARQVAERMGAECDPTRMINVNETMIFIKAMPFGSENIKFLTNAYVDILDAGALVPDLRYFPNLKVIAVSKVAKDYISARVDNRVVVIPEHHCNFETVFRPDREVKLVGFIGYAESFDLVFADVKKALKSVGLDFIYLVKAKNRQEVCEFYKKIDIQLTYRKYTIFPELKNPLKLKNAGSFKIPSVCYPEYNYVKQWKGNFMPVSSIDEIVTACKILAHNKTMYVDMAEKAYEKSKNWHIDDVVKIYKRKILR